MNKPAAGGPTCRATSIPTSALLATLWDRSQGLSFKPLTFPVGPGTGRLSGSFVILSLSLLALYGCGAQSRARVQQRSPSPGELRAEWHRSGFAQGSENYNSCDRASDGKIYYVLSSNRVDTGAQMYVYDPATGKVRHLGDLTQVVGEKGLKAVPQGKSHVHFVESKGKLYFATHVGYYNTSENGKEKLGAPPPGYKPYPGGHFLSYDLATGRFEDLARFPGEGILSMAMDTRRGRLYGLTWPSGNFLVYDLANHTLSNLGPASERSEAGQGSKFGVLCRSLALDPDDGSVYFTTTTGVIKRYRYDRKRIEVVEGCNLKKDFFGSWDPDKPGHQGYNWRQIVWYPAEKVFYGVHGNSGYLFRFDPRKHQVEVLRRIVSERSRHRGMYDEFPYGYLGFTLGPDGRTLYYLTGAPGPQEKGAENIDLITYDIPTSHYVDHGPLVLANGDRPTCSQSIAIGNDGQIYTVAQLRKNGRPPIDLISFRNPLSN